MGCGRVHLWGVEGSIYGAGESTYGVWRGPSMGRGGSIYGGIYGAGESIYGAGGVHLGGIYGAGESIYGAGGSRGSAPPPSIAAQGHK